MTIYLMIKTHINTGLKYLCKTSRTNPYTYPGSGTRWIHHLKKHGYDYTTEIIKECQSNDEIKEWGLYYSNLWNIVESTEWANLKPESGDGGSRKGSSKGRKQSPVTTAKIIATKIKNGTVNTNTPEITAKIMATKIKNGTVNTTSIQSIAKRLETRRKNGTINTITSESIVKQLATKKRNGTLNVNTPDRIEKMKATLTATLDKKREMGILQPKVIKEKLNKICICSYCGKQTNPANFVRWHDINCKLNK